MIAKTRIGFLLTHPIQYYSPLFRYLTEHAPFEVKVFYQSSCSVVGQFEREFGRTVMWDNDLLSGYDHEFLPTLGGNKILSRWRPFCYGLKRRLVVQHIEFLIITGYNRPFHLYVVWLCWRLGIKAMIRDDSTLFSKHRGHLKSFLKSLYFRYFTALKVTFLAVGKANREYYLAHKIPESHVATMHWAVDNAFFRRMADLEKDKLPELRRSLGISDGQTVFLFVGKFAERKGVLDLLSAFTAAHDSVQKKPALIFVGDGALGDVIWKAAHDCAGIKIVGFKNQTELPSYYQLCDVLILPSIDSETWGLVVNEAMSLGKPAIVSNVVGCWRDLVDSPATGWVFHAGSVDSLKECIIGACNRAGKQDFEGDCKGKVADYSFESNLQSLAGLISSAV